MIHHSDQALYQAKRQGRNRTIVYDAGFQLNEVAPNTKSMATPRPAARLQGNDLAFEQLREIHDLLTEISRTAKVRAHDERLVD